jgi:hypothetical protein
VLDSIGNAQVIIVYCKRFEISVNDLYQPGSRIASSSSSSRIFSTLSKRYLNIMFLMR